MKIHKFDKHKPPLKSAGQFMEQWAQACKIQNEVAHSLAEKLRSCGCDVIEVQDCFIVDVNAGTYDYLEKLFEDNEKIKHAIKIEKFKRLYGG